VETVNLHDHIRDQDGLIALLRAEVLALKQERDALKLSRDQARGCEADALRQVTSARASERRLRELLAWAAMMLPAPWPLPATIGRRIQDAIKGVTIKAEQAFTGDTPGQEGER
jgi:hypothetical protein